MFNIVKAQIITMLLTLGIFGDPCLPAVAAVQLNGQVQAGGAPLASSTVTLWATSEAEPRQLAQTRSGSDGRFQIRSDESIGPDVTLYLIAKGGEVADKGRGNNPAVALLSVLGSTPPSIIVINEMTTVASVWTHAQFLEGTAIKGPLLGLKIAATNVPNFVDRITGGWGVTIQDPLNSGQTPTMANFASLADLLSGCTTQVKADACSELFAAAMPPIGNAPTDTLTAARAMALYPWHQPERLFALLEDFYPVPVGKTLRPVPFMPYLNFPPSAWVLPLKFDGGGYRAGGGGGHRQRGEPVGW